MMALPEVIANCPLRWGPSASFSQSRDPQLQLSLDSYSDVFAVSAGGIARYLTLARPLDREARDTYTFTVSIGARYPCPIRSPVVPDIGRRRCPSHSLTLATTSGVQQTRIHSTALYWPAAAESNGNYRPSECLLFDFKATT